MKVIFLLLSLSLAYINDVQAIDEHAPPPAGIKAHKPLEFLDSIKNEVDPGPKVYQHICATCHDVEPVIQLGAPRFQVTEDWLFRQKKGMDQLLENLINGIGSMPPRGGCFECSDTELKAAIQYMLPLVKPLNSKN